MCRFIFLLITGSLLLPSIALAQPGAVPPTYSVSPVFNGLNVTYYVKADTFKIALYVINHETYPVICDANYSSGPDKQNKAEETINPEKGTVFKFTYGRRSNHVLLRVICVKPGSPEHLHHIEPEDD